MAQLVHRCLMERPILSSSWPTHRFALSDTRRYIRGVGVLSRPFVMHSVMRMVKGLDHSRLRQHSPPDGIDANWHPRGCCRGDSIKATRVLTYSKDGGSNRKMRVWSHGSHILETRGHTTRRTVDCSWMKISLCIASISDFHHQLP